MVFSEVLSTFGAAIRGSKSRLSRVFYQSRITSIRVAVSIPIARLKPEEESYDIILKDVKPHEGSRANYAT